MMRALALIVVAMVLGCGGDDATAVDLNLVTDLNLNTEAQLVAWVTNVEVQIDSDAGLYTADQARVTAQYSIENVDDDDALELVIRSSVLDGRLPNIRIERGGLPGTGLEFRVLGPTADGRHVASGGVSGVAFAKRSRQSVAVQFNLKSDYLAPRVTEVYPRNDEQTCRAGVALLIFSKSLDPSTVIPGQTLLVTREGETEATPVNAAVEGPIVRVVFGVLTSGPARYHITVTPDVRDSEGLAFDQEPARDGGQNFTSEFDVVVGTDACTSYPYRWCHESGGILECPDFREGRLRCEDGVCVLHSCDGSTCGDGYVCDPSSAQCVIDCRVYGGVESCATDAMTCDEATGVCTPITP